MQEKQQGPGAFLLVSIRKIEKIVDFHANLRVERVGRLTGHRRAEASASKRAD